MKIEFNNDLENIKKITDVVIIIGCFSGLIEGIVTYNWGQVLGFTMAILARI